MYPMWGLGTLTQDHDAHPQAGVMTTNQKYNIIVWAVQSTQPSSVHPLHKVHILRASPLDRAPPRA